MEALSADEVRAIAREAYTYGWPMLENFNTLFAYVLDEGGAKFKAPFNTIHNEARCFTPADTVIVTPNSDTPYSFAWLDLRAEPMVLTVPPIEEGRYWSFQVIDLFTHNFAYLGTRATGNGGGSYLLSGPGWSSSAPSGCEVCGQCETLFAFIIVRTQLFAADDLEKVKAIQAQFKCEPLSKFMGVEAPPAPPPIPFPKALGQEGNKTRQAFEVIDFMLSHMAPTVHASEEAVRARFLRLGIGSGSFSVSSLDAASQAALDEAMAEAWQQCDEVLKGKVSSADLFGTREHLARGGAHLPHYVARFVGAKIGLYGNSGEEAMYPLYKVLDGKPLDASVESYTLRMTPEDMRIAKSFWSLTMYDGVSQLLVENPINRYLINSPMLGGLRLEEDGSLIIRISASSPGPELEANWLPAPKGPFYMAMRLYWPEPAAYEGKWQQPVLQRC